MVLGVMGLLMGMLIPSVGVVREKAQRMATGHKLRQIALAVATYHAATGRSLSADSLEDWMRKLAEETGVCEGELFVFEEDPLVAAIGDEIPPVLVKPSGAGSFEGVDSFSEWPIGIAVASGIRPVADPSTTPVAWTRGLTPEGTWLDHGGERAGVYGAEGGFIVFLDGHVRFYRDLREDGGRLVVYGEGTRTHDIRQALGPGTKAFDYRGPVF